MLCWWSKDWGCLVGLRCPTNADSRDFGDEGILEIDHDVAKLRPVSRTMFSFAALLTNLHTNEGTMVYGSAPATVAREGLRDAACAGSRWRASGRSLRCRLYIEAL